MSRFIALHCGDETAALLANYPTAFLLLTQVGIRAKWKDCPITGMKAGEALIGDWRNAGLKSPKSYEVAKKRLEKCGLVRFQGGNRGTRAFLLNSTIFSVSAETRGKPAADLAGSQGEADGNQGGSNNTENTEKTEKQTAFALDGASSSSGGKDQNSPLMIRIGKLFNRRETTRWSEKERRALKALMPLDPEEVALVERFHGVHMHPEERDNRRTSVETLLNNWPTELDRANLYFASKKS